MGRQSALVEWCSGNVRSFLSRCGAMARRGSEPSSLAGHGPGHDILDAAELLLCGWNVGHVMDRLDLGQHCLGYPREEEPARPPHLRRGSRCLETGRGEDVEYPALA